MSFTVKLRNKLGTLFFCLVLILGKGIIGKFHYEIVRNRGIETTGIIVQKQEVIEWFSQDKIHYLIVQFNDSNGFVRDKKIKVNPLIYETTIADRAIKIKYLKSSPNNAIAPGYERPISTVGISVFIGLIIISGAGFLISIEKTYKKGYPFNFYTDGIWFITTITASIILIVIIPI